ncbi:hypothetical protein D3C72_1950430 [compost metagenome]
MHIRTRPGDSRHAQFFEYILSRLNQLGALAYQRMATARLRRVDRPGDCEHLSPLFHRHPCGDQRTGGEGGLYHQRPLGEPRNDAVAFREICGEWRRPQGVLADQQAIRCNAVGEIQVFARVDPVQPGSNDRDRGRRV